MPEIGDRRVEVALEVTGQGVIVRAADFQRDACLAVIAQSSSHKTQHPPPARLGRVEMGMNQLDRLGRIHSRSSGAWFIYPFDSLTGYR